MWAFDYLSMSFACLLPFLLLCQSLRALFSTLSSVLSETSFFNAFILLLMYDSNKTKIQSLYCDTVLIEKTKFQSLSCFTVTVLNLNYRRETMRYWRARAIPKMRHAGQLCFSLAIEWISSQNFKNCFKTHAEAQTTFLVCWCRLFFSEIKCSRCYAHGKA